MSPNASCTRPRLIAVRSSVSSGNEVPIATILAPIRIGGTPKASAIFKAEVTVRRAEITTIVKLSKSVAITTVFLPLLIALSSFNLTSGVREIVGTRLRSLSALLAGKRAVVVVPVRSFMRKIMPPGDLAEAITYFETAVEITPGYAEAHHNLATALSMTAQPRRAVEQFQLAARAQPESDEAAGTNSAANDSTASDAGSADAPAEQRDGDSRRDASGAEGPDEV